MATFPLIGITCAVQPVNDRPQAVLNATYTQAVLAAGGLPVILPADLPAESVETCLSRLDGLVLSGGNDIDPAYFGQERHPKLGIVEPERDALELAAARWAFEHRLPTLGICRGEQVMAVAVGGTLWQDAPSQVADCGTHRYPSDTQPDQLHPVTILPNSRLAAIMGDAPHPVNTFHHQAVDQPGPLLRACAWAPDGVIEAVEAESGFYLGVQWHPERLIQRDEKALALFTAFIAAARARK